jgi:Tfp pilus assembly protein PilN
MKVINFLPQDYLARRGRRRANIACLIIGSGAILVIGLAVAFTFVSMLAAMAMRALVEKQYQQASLQVDQLKQLEDRKAGLIRKVELSTDLLERVPRSHLLARLTNHLPANTSLMMLLMKIEDVDVKASEAAAWGGDKKAPAASDDKAAAGSGNASKSTASKRSKTTKPDMVKVKQCVFHLNGLAPTDVEVAEYISHLVADPLFRDVNLQVSEGFPYKEGVQMRRFELSFRLSPDAEKIFEPAAADVAKAAPAPALAKGES